MKNLYAVSMVSLSISFSLWANEAADKALFDAIEVPSLEGVKKAFADGASVDAKDKYKRTPFAKALNLYSNSRSRAKISPEKTKEHEIDKAIVYEIFNHMTTFTPDDFIGTSTAGGLRDLAEKMLTKGMAVDARGRSGLTALMEVVNGYPDLEDVKFLVSKGADINAVDKNGRSVLNYSLSPGTSEQFKAADYLIDKGAQLKPEHFVHAVAGARNSDLALVRKIHQKLGLIDAVDYMGWTALRNALVLGDKNKDIINYLLDQNANVNAMGQGDAESLLFLAIRNYYYFPDSSVDLAIIKKILEHSAKVDATTLAFALGDFPEVARLFGPEAGGLYKDYQQPDSTKKEQVMQLLKGYTK